MLEKGEARSSWVSWGRSKGKEGSIKRPEVRALGPDGWVGNQLRADGLQSRADGKGTGRMARAPYIALGGVGTSRNVM